jgi:hypothetical protein
MSVRFNCPKCGELIAFPDKHAGRRAKCLSCGQLFIIPSKDEQLAQVIEPPSRQQDRPLPGFYRAVFVENWKLFVDPHSATTLVFVSAAVCFKFFLSPEPCCGYITYFVVWGWLFGLYLNIIFEAASGVHELPQIYLGTAVTFFWHIIKPFLIFFITIVAVMLPCILAISILRDESLTAENMWEFELGPRLIVQALFVLGLSVFPAAILAVAVGQDITLLRPSCLFKPIRRALRPYLVTFALLVAFGVIELRTKQYTGAGPAETTAHLTLNLALQVLAIIAMRAIGLFYYHYNCFFAW